MEEIIDNLYLGSFAEVQDIKSKVSTGFVACLSIGSEFCLGLNNETEFQSIDKIQLPNLNSIGIAHKTLSLDDGSDNCIVKILPEALEFIDQHIGKGKVYVHCFAGVSRSASIVFAYMLTKGFKPIPAFNLLTNKRGKVHPYHSFIEEILNYFNHPSVDKVLHELHSGLYWKPLKK
jgi:protein-tyrosine phosphatase